ncbi:MAG: glycosyltransferase family 4 protein [Proteobacteria bacterium]|nr:glycosyltransferase family 4 protein [Pseudomonadota bacterium]
MDDTAVARRASWHPQGAGSVESAPVVCMLCPGGTEHAGGIGRWAGYMLHEWRDQGLTPPLEIVDTRGFGGWTVAGTTFARALWRLLTLRRRGRLGIIHANLAVRGSAVRKCIVGVFARAAGVPLIVQLHAGHFFDFYDNLPPPGRLALRKLFASAARIIVLGHVWQERVVAELGIPSERITVLYNSVHAPARLARTDAPDGVCHIVMLGRLGPPKGLPELLEAMASEGMRARAWRATLAGDGDVEAVMTEARRRGIADRVVCPGWLGADAVAALLAQADILVLPSRSENLPVAVIEALAYRIAVVTTPVGATPELVEDGVSALFVPTRNPEALAEALGRLIDDPVLRAEIARRGHEVFTARLDASVAAPILASIYQTVMAQPRG